ncbi:MAG: sulfatase-like hydrolase/transferase [Planctomycetes bacterium]|nr:sulfatase-like hydrolase/transferase [Planctomycetota bacterium]
MRRAALLLIALACAPSCSKAPPRPNLLLVTLDTTRVEALGCYTKRPGVTPRLDELARESLVFDRARSVAPLTLPAHSSIMTGLYPPRHLVRDNGLAPLPASARTAAEELADAGYQTAAFVSAAVLDHSWGIAQGFERFDDPPQAVAGGVHLEERDGRETTQHALDWLAQRRKDEPFFAWVHLFEPHAPYAPPPEFLAQAHGDAYLGEVAAADHEVGRILDALRASGALENTLVIVTADHGESLGQHGEPTHSIFCYEATIHVPLLVRLPGGKRAGERSGATVSLVDLMPTLLAAAGASPLTGLDGRDLFGAEAPADRSVYFESYCGWLNYAWSPICGAARGDEKYIWSGTEELYDLAGDRAEKTNLAGSRPADCAAWRARVAALVAGKPLVREHVEQADAAQRARVEQLGYAGAGEATLAIPAPLVSTGLPAPSERKPELAAYYAALEAEVAGKHDEAIAGLRALLAQNPRNYSAGDILGALLVAQGKHEEALKVLESLQLTGRERASTHLSLAQCCEALGRLDQARKHRERAAELQR